MMILFVYTLIKSKISLNNRYNVLILNSKFYDLPRKPSIKTQILYMLNVTF